VVKIANKLSKSDQLNVTSLLSECLDIYKDFYITKNNLRLFIKDNLDLFFKDLTKGDKILFNENGILVICGFSDESPRKYIKILTKENNLQVANVLIQHAIGNFNNIDLFIKIKKVNPVLQILYNNGFIWQGSRGVEVLLVKKAEKINVKS